MLSRRDVRKGIRKRPPSLQARGPQLRVWQAHRNVMNDTVVTECLEHPDAEHEHKARSNDRDPVRRTSSRPADICAAPKGRTYDRSRPNRSTRRKRLPWGRPHMPWGRPHMLGGKIEKRQQSVAVLEQAIDSPVVFWRVFLGENFHGDLGRRAVFGKPDFSKILMRGDLLARVLRASFPFGDSRPSLTRRA
jgi:hypothetical protein